MRNYLLGTLSNDEASELERQYFTDPAVLRELKLEERSLIEDYLDGELEPAEKQQFERRYLRVPELKRVVEDVRQQRRVAAARRNSRVWGSIAAGALVAGAGLSAWVYMHQQAPAPVTIAQNIPPSRVTPTVGLRLSPGLTKSEGAKTAGFVLPAETSNIQITAELPGAQAGAAYTAAIVEIGGSKLWVSKQPIQSVAASSGQELVFSLDSTLFHRGDYMLELSGPDGAIKERYIFRVTVPTGAAVNQ